MSSPSPDADVLVAGAGAMAEEHVKSLVAAGFSGARLLLVGKSRERVEAVAARYGVRSAWGGFEALDGEVPPLAVVAVPEESLAAAARSLVERGCRHVLVEKPGALRSSELAALRDAAGRAGARVFVAYNRRFYPSVARARELVEADGGPLALAFEFTEVERLVLRDAERRRLSRDTLARWGVANSLHVIDLAFHLAGAPEGISATRAGSLPWHPAGAVFAGSGLTERGAAFSYGAAWSGAGRWGIEVATAARRLVLRPLEELREQRRGGFELEPVELPAEPEGLKPGLAGQLAAFLSAARGGTVDPALCGVDEALARVALAERMLGYG